MTSTEEESSSTFDKEYDDFFFNILLVDEIDNNAEDNARGALRNKDGSARKVKRADYSRTEKRIKIEGNPWNGCAWLLLISDPETAIPTSRQGKVSSAFSSVSACCSNGQGYRITGV